MSNKTSDETIYAVAHAILGAAVHTNVRVVDFLIDAIDQEDVDAMFGKDYREYGGEATFEIGCVAARAAIAEYERLNK